jgi:MoaA/NifB/PqqE/SkfB family radical SAM enzyme
MKHPITANPGTGIRKAPEFAPFYFSGDELRSVDAEGRMLVLMAETLGLCTLACKNCYRQEAHVNGGLDGVLPIEQRIELIRAAARLGTTAYHIVGAGEPICDPDFRKQVTAAIEHDMRIMVPISGYGYSDEQLEFLAGRGQVGILIKLNSRSSETEQHLTGKADFAEKRDAALGKLIKWGLNRVKELPDGRRITRLAASTMVTTLNRPDALSILEFCRQNDIAPFMTTHLLPNPRTDEGGLVPDARAMDELKRKAMVQDARMGIENDGGPYIGGHRCRQRGLGLYVDITGNVRICTGESPIGNIRNSKDLSGDLDRMWHQTREKTKAYRNAGGRSCPPRMILPA